MRCGASHANAALIEALLTAGWSIELVCFAKSREKVLVPGGISKFNCQIRIIRWHRFFDTSIVRSLFYYFFRSSNNGLPITAAAYASASVVRKIDCAISASNAPCVVWDGLHPLAALCTILKKGFDLSNDKKHFYRAHNIESKVWQKTILNSNRLTQILLRKEIERMKQFEFESLLNVDAVLTLNPEEQSELKTLTSPGPVVGYVPVSFAVSTAPKKRRRISVQKGQALAHENLRLIWLGGMQWHPNRFGLKWFMEEVWPEVHKRRQDVELTLIGSGTERWKRGSSSRIEAVGRVDSIESWMEQAHLLIVPIFFGAGVRIKALEALACGVACVGTSIGLSGVPSQGAFFCEGSDDWRALLLAVTPEACRTKGLQGQSQVIEKYSHSCAVDAFESCLY